MTSSGIRDVESIDDRVRKLSRQSNSDMIESFKNAKEEITIGSGGSSASTSNSPSGNFMPLDGNEWLGYFGNINDIGIIENGVVNINKINGLNKRLTLLNAQNGVLDNLDTISSFDINPLFYFEKYIQIVGGGDVILRPKIKLVINNIVGDGGTTVTVTMSDTSELDDDDNVSISSTTNYNVFDVIITVTSGTTFTYQTQSPTNTTPEITGAVNRGNLKLPSDVKFFAPIGTFLHFIFDTGGAPSVMTLDYASNGISAPIKTVSVEPTNKDKADIAFGAAIGTIGFSDNGSDVKMFVKQSNGNWAINIFGDGTLS